MTTSTPRPKLYSQEAHLEEHQERQYPREALRLSIWAGLMHVMHTPHPTHPIPPLRQSYTLLQLEDSQLLNPAAQSWGSQSPKALWELGDPPPSQDSPSGYTFHTR